jgi:hypothetical protein
VVATTNTVCNSPNLSASVTSANVWGPGFGAAVFEITSKAPCTYSGYPNVQEQGSGGNSAPITETDGGSMFWKSGDAPVTIGPSTPVEFVVSAGGPSLNNAPYIGCPLFVPVSLTLSLPGLSGSIPFSGKIPNLCGPIAVTPVIQGSDPGEFGI